MTKRLNHLIFVAVAAMTLAFSSAMAPQSTFADAIVSCNNACNDPTGG